MKSHYLILALFILAFLMNSCTPKYACLNIITTPPSAYIDYCDNGEHLGTSPIQAEVFNLGKNKKKIIVLAKLEGYEDKKQSITIEKKVGKRAKADKYCKTIHIQLEKEKEKETEIFTKVKISSDPDNAHIYSNEQYIGETGGQEFYYFTWNSHLDRKEIRIEKSGFNTERRMITPKDDRVNIVLHSNND